MLCKNDPTKQETLFDATQWMDARILERLNRSWAPIFYKEVFMKIDETPFAVLYSNTGSPNFPVNILLSLEYIKHMKNCSDAELLEYYDFDYLVNYAVGNRRLGERPMAERTLYNFRERVYKYSFEHPESDDILFGQFEKLTSNFADEAEIKMTEQRVDTTMFMSNIKKAGRISLAYDVLNQAIKAIPEDKRSDKLLEVLEPGFKTDTLYRSKGEARESRLTLLLNLCKEASGILNDLADADEAAKRILNRFIEEQTVQSQDGTVKAKNKHDIEATSLQSAFDEDATYRSKAGKGQSGYVLEIAETCNKENDFQLITDYRVEQNVVSDTEIIKNRIERIATQTGCEKMYADGGFYAPDVMDEAKKAAVDIHLTNMTGAAPKRNLPASEYETEPESCVIARCPAGHKPDRTSISKSQSVAHFPKATCEGCAMKDQCHVKIQKKSAVVRISLKSFEAAAVRASIINEKKENTSMRAAIEGSNSAMKRKGLRKLAVRGISKSSVVCDLKAAAQNISRFINFRKGGYKKKEKVKINMGEVCPN